MYIYAIIVFFMPNEIERNFTFPILPGKYFDSSDIKMAFQFIL